MNPVTDETDLNMDEVERQRKKDKKRYCPHCLGNKCTCTLKKTTNWPEMVFIGLAAIFAILIVGELFVCSSVFKFSILKYLFKWGLC